MSESSTDVAATMSGILGSMIAGIAGLCLLQKPTKSGGEFLPSQQPSKRAYESFALLYTPIWIAAFACIVAFRLFEDFDEWSYLKVCVGLALPFLLQPILLPSAGFHSPDAKRPLTERYSFRANLWLAIYSFIGNYWYTHYFYSVLKATYTMPAHRLNNVPIALFFATHFYFSTYHVFSNLMLRKVCTAYQPGILRTVLYVVVVLAFAYFTAFMETLTISAYPDYTFEDRTMAYTVGSAFYGIYFIVSFPAFYLLEHDIDRQPKTPTSIWETVVSSCGHGMIILQLLDVVRLYLGIPLVVGAPPIASA